MSAPSETQRGPLPSTAWMIVCGAICAAILAYGLLGYKSVTGGMAYQAGRDLPVALVLSGVLYFAFLKREKSGTGWLGLLLVYASLVGASYLASQRVKADIRDAVSQVHETLSAIQEANITGTAAPEPKPVVASGSSEGARMGAVMQALVNRSLVQRREYELELEAIGWSSILDAKRLNTDPTLSESREILQKAGDVVEKYRQKTARIFTEMREDIERSDLSAETRRSMLEGFDSTLEQGKAQAAELWGLEEAVVDEIGKIIDLLAARRKDWQIENNQILFQEQHDLDQFNSHMAEVQVIVAKQQEMQSASIQRSKDALDRVTR